MTGPATPGGPGLPDSARALLDAVVAISTDLDLHRVLQRIVASACALTGARYGALGVLDQQGRALANFVTLGFDAEVQAAVGNPPVGRGLLGVLIEEPRPLRLEDLTDHPQFAGFPAHHPPMRTFLGVPILVGGTAFGNLYLTEKAGGEAFTDLDEHLVLALAGAAGHVVSNARAYGLSERRRRWLEATSTLVDSLSPSVAVEDALVEITNTVRSVSGADAVAAVQRGGQGPVVLTADGGQPDLVDGVVAALGDRLGGATTSSLSVPLDAEPVHALVVPLRSALATSLVLLVIDRSPELLTDPDEQSFLAACVDHAAMALDRALAVADRAALAVVSDRDRIARDLHDLVIQRLFATGMKLQGLRMLARHDDLADRLDEAVDDIDLTIKDIRGTIFELQHRSGSSLRSDIRTLVREYVPVLGFTPEVRTTGPVDTAIREPVRGELLAVLREALSNVARHAFASSAVVELDVGEAHVELRVVDDGQGPPPTRSESGLTNARRRATSLGGRFTFRAHDPAGSAFVWHVPIPG